MFLAAKLAGTTKDEGRMDTTVETAQARFKLALKELRKEGIIFRSNVRKCCRSCVEPKQLGLTEETEDTAPFAWFFGGQGNAITWRFGAAKFTQRMNSREDVTIFINHGNGAAETVQRVFSAHGFEVDWDGTDSMCVVVNLSSVRETTGAVK